MGRDGGDEDEFHHLANYALRQLLAEYHDICERILDEQEIDVGVLAYRKGSRNVDAQPHFRLRNLRNSREDVGFGRRACS